jgi:outer membrane protein assembly factor BamB
MTVMDELDNFPGRSGLGVKARLAVLISAIGLMLSLAGCAVTLSENLVAHPVSGIAWEVQRQLTQGLSLAGREVDEKFAVSGNYLIDVLVLPAAGEAYGTIGPSLTVRDLVTGKPLWRMAKVPGFPAVTRDALYIGKHGYELGTGKQFDIPTAVPPGGVPDPAATGVLVVAGSGKELIDLKPRTGTVAWRAAAAAGHRFCGPLTVGRSTAIAIQCRAFPQTYVGPLAQELDCFDPATGLVRWTRPVGGTSIGDGTVEYATIAVAGQTVTVGPDVALSAVTGSSLKDLAPALARISPQGLPVLQIASDGTAFVGARNTSAPPLGASLGGIRTVAHLDLRTGRVLWTIHLGRLTSPADFFVTDDQNLYLVSGSQLTAYGLKTGLREWRTTFTANLFDNGKNAYLGNPALVAAASPSVTGGIVGPSSGPFVISGLLISITAAGGLAAIRLGP